MVKMSPGPIRAGRDVLLAAAEHRAVATCLDLETAMLDALAAKFREGIA
jgi:hypothetical protein